MLNLTSHLQGKHHHVYCDNFFSSPRLFDALLERGLYACGTVQVTAREFPADLKVLAKKGKKKAEAEMGLRKRGDSIARQRGALTATAWLDNKVVNVLSTICETHDTQSTKRKAKNGTRIEVPCPNDVLSYCKNMGGVDRNDQLRHYYRVRLKSRKNYKYIFWFLFDLAITNAYIIYTTQQRPIPYRNFHEQLAKQLVLNYCSRKRPGRTGPQKMPPWHFLQHYPERNRTNKKGVQRCKYCSSRGIRKETVWQCKVCNMALCHTGAEDDCFKLHHEKIHQYQLQSIEQ